MLKISNASKSFGKHCIFENLNIEINAFGLYIVKGESGSGKSTLLNLLAGYDKFDSGTFEIDSNVATIFQNYELIPELTIQENILLLKSGFDESDMKILEILELNPLLNNYPDELSGGQKQRVGIARALLLNPNIILCDEPTESLDIDNKRIVMNLLAELSNECIVLIATHDDLMVKEYGGVILKIIDHDIKFDKSEITDKECVIHTNKKKKGNKDIYYLIYKIIGNKTKIASIIIVLMTIIIQQLYIVNQKMFYIPNSTNTVNADILYIDAYKDEFDSSVLGLENDNVTPVIPFYSLNIDGKYESFEFYPYEENALELTGNEPIEYNVVINQNLAEYLKKWKDCEITVSYSFSGIDEEIVFKIVGVVNEIDSNRYSIYYDSEYLLNEFDKREIMIVENHQSFMISLKDYLTRYGTNYKTNIPYDSTQNYYDMTANMSAINVYNVLYDQREATREESIIFKILFYILEFILYLGLIIFIIIYISKDTNRYLGTCAVLASNQINFQDINRQYLSIKFKFMECYFILGEVLFILLNFLGNNFVLITYIEVIALFLIFVSVLFVYFLTTLICMRKLRLENISKILKDNMDQ